MLVVTFVQGYIVRRPHELIFYCFHCFSGEVLHEVAELCGWCSIDPPYKVTFCISSILSLSLTSAVHLGVRKESPKMSEDRKSCAMHYRLVDKCLSNPRMKGNEAVSHQVQCMSSFILTV